EQWLLSKEKLPIIQQLVQEQLEEGHIKPSTSPWNTPIFVIPKKSGKWRLLHNLRAVNAVMLTMDALQPGLPSPTMIPESWNLLIIDLKDCFFTIPLHLHDTSHFAFSVPSVNKSEPYKRYEWVCLPQGMKNSPTMCNSPMMCQIYVAWALEPVRKQFPEYIIYHYMDDILVAGKQLDCATVLKTMTVLLEKRGLRIAPDKVQSSAPWKYLGWQIDQSVVKPQKLTITTEIKTVHDVQKLVGDIQWIRNICGITNEELEPLIQLLGTSSW
ncbi:POK18 protein, partial [Nesospiza acunhae]|nr:POK18 protein [Nesospiza acunhae]